MTLERFKNFSKNQQLLMLGSEIMRAKTWQNKDNNNFILNLERAFELIDLTIADPKWQEQIYNLFYLRSKIAEFYAGLDKSDIEILYKAL